MYINRIRNRISDFNPYKLSEIDITLEEFLKFVLKK